MDELVHQFIEIFNALRQPDDAIVSQASEAVQELLKSQDSIFALIQILNDLDNSTYKNYAAIFLGMCINRNLDEIQDKQAIVGQCLDTLLKETDYELQRLIINAIDQIDNELAPTILEFAQTALQQDEPHLINAAILLCNSNITEIELAPDTVKFLIDLINSAIQKLPLLYPLDLAFTLGNNLGDSVEEENIPFFNQMWEESINFVCQNTDDVHTVKSIVNLLNDSLDHEDNNNALPFFVNPTPILERFLPMLGDTSLDLDVNLYILSSINLALDIRGVLDGVDVEEFFPSTFQKLMQISAMAYNPDDSFYMSCANVFEDFCFTFSYSELDTSDFFIGTVLSLVETYYPEAETKPGSIIALGYIIGEGTDTIIDSLPQICQLLIESVNNESKLVRDCAAFTILELATNLEDEIEDYIEDLINAVLQSLSNDITPDMLRSLENLLESAKDTDPIFENAYNFLMEKMSSAHESALHYYFPCLIELCTHSKNKIRDVFDQLIPIVFNTLEEATSENMVELGSRCLAYLSVSAPELFAPHVQKFAEMMFPYLKTETLLTEALLSFGKLMENHSEQLRPVLPELIPQLLEIGSKDTVAALTAEIIIKKEKNDELIANGEVEFDCPEEEDEDDDEKLSPYAIPSLALSVFGRVSFQFPEIIPENLDQVMKELDLQMKNPNKDAIQQTCNAISLLSRAISKVEVPPETKSGVATQFCNWAVRLVNEATNISSGAQAIEATGQIIELFGVSSIGDENLSNIIKIISDALDKNLKCQDEKMEYDKEFHDQFCNMVCELIASLGLSAPSVLESLVPAFFNLLTSKKSQFRDIAIKILGYFVEHSSENLPHDFKENVYKYVVNGIRQNSRNAAFALNQFTNNDGDIIMENMQDLMQLIYEKLESLSKKKAISSVAFIDNLVAALGEIRRCVLNDEFPISEFGPICLSLMPAREDNAVNLDMMKFYIWLANAMQMQPANEFATVAIKLFMVPRSEIGGIAEDDSGTLDEVASILVNCLQLIGDDAENLIVSVCENDPFKVERIKSVINPVE